MPDKPRSRSRPFGSKGRPRVFALQGGFCDLCWSCPNIWVAYQFENGLVIYERLCCGKTYGVYRPDLAQDPIAEC